MSGNITHKWNGTVLTITSDSGTSSADLRGEKGDTGIRGPQGATGFTIGNDGLIDTSGLATESYVTESINNADRSYLNGYATQSYVDTVVADFEANNGLTTTEKNLLITILRNAVYTSEEMKNIIDTLEAALAHSPASLHYKVINNLTYVTTNNLTVSVAQGYVYNATITPYSGCLLDKVIVTMGGNDITESCYKGGVINIPVVTGDIIISATAFMFRYDYEIIVGNHEIYWGTEESPLANILYKPANENKNRAVIAPATYARKGIRYKFSLGDISNSYNYSPVFSILNKGDFNFTYTGTQMNLGSVNIGKLKSWGWGKNDISYDMVSDGYILLTVNFKKIDDSNMTEDDIKLLKENFTVEMEVI
jgi:hypothetical protein